MKALILLSGVLVMLVGCGLTPNPPLSALESDWHVVSAMRKELNKPTGEVTKDYLPLVKKLDLEGLFRHVPGWVDETEYERSARGQADAGMRARGLTNIRALAHLTNLTELNLSFNEITDLSPLAGLTQLKRLNLSYNRGLIDVTPLEGLKQLEYLDLAGCGRSLSYDHRKYDPENEKQFLTIRKMIKLRKALPKCKIHWSDPRLF